MKTKFLKALIIDQDPAQGRALATLVKELFNQIHFTLNVDEIIKECQELKPRVIFFNLNVAQRTSNFELLEKMTLEGDSQTVLFGYIDSHEPELVAHAIELGFHDIFVKPFDADIMATKINKFFQFDKTQGREINFSNIQPVMSGKIQMALKLMTVDENGISFKTDHYLSKGAIFRLDSPLIKDIFEETPVELMITRTWLGDNWGEHFFFAEPRNAGEKTSASLRRFILRKV